MTGLVTANGAEGRESWGEQFASLLFARRDRSRGITGRKKLKPFSAAKIDSIPLAVLDSAALSCLLQPRTALSEGVREGGSEGGRE